MSEEELRDRIAGDEKLLRRAEKALTQIKVAEGLSEEHAGVLAALRIRLKGDAVPLEYEVEGGKAFARLRLREGQARRLTAAELPPLDRPLRFAVIRAGESPLRTETLEELKELLRSPGRRTQTHRHRPAPRRGGRRR